MSHLYHVYQTVNGKSILYLYYMHYMFYMEERYIQLRFVNSVRNINWSHTFDYIGHIKRFKDYKRNRSTEVYIM